MVFILYEIVIYSLESTVEMKLNNNTTLHWLYKQCRDKIPDIYCFAHACCRHIETIIPEYLHVFMQNRYTCIQ